MIKEAIEKVVSKQDLTYDEAYTVMNEIMNGETSQVQNAAYLAALSTKSAKAETIDEISGSAAAMRDHALKVAHDMDVLEIVGTGGDHAGSINISTTAAFLIAAAGISVVKVAMFHFDLYRQTGVLMDAFDLKKIAFFVVAFAAIKKFKLHPVVYIACAAVVGILLSF